MIWMLRWLISIESWSAGLIGTLSRCVTLLVLAIWIVTADAGWRDLRPGGRGGWLVFMGAISILVNLTWLSAVQRTTAINVGMLIRFDVVFVVLVGAMLGLERIGFRQLALIPVMFGGLALLMEVHKFDWGGRIVGDAITIVAAHQSGLAVEAEAIQYAHPGGSLGETTSERLPCARTSEGENNSAKNPLSPGSGGIRAYFLQYFTRRYVLGTGRAVPPGCLTHLVVKGSAHIFRMAEAG